MVAEDSNRGCPDRQLCAEVSKMSREDPIGTAAMHDRYLLVEVPVPWEFHVVQSKYFPAGLEEVIKKAKEQGLKIRFLSFVSDDHPSPKGFRRVLYYMKPCTPFARYEKTEYLLPEKELNTLAEMILHFPEKLSRFNAYMQDTADVRDFFVCTHGSHDICCGKFGFPIYKMLEENFAVKSSGKVRAWRVSHFGGHRYAPAIAEFPEGRYWAHIKPADLDTLVHRKGEFSVISRKYRGWGGVGKYVQMLEREILIREGWDWIEYNKSGTVVNEAVNSVRVRIEYASVDGMISGAYEGTVTPSNNVEVGGCGYDVKEVLQYQLLNIMKLH